MSTPTRFYLVWGIGKPAPTVQHPDKETADKEARRLAEKHPGTIFVVMEPVEAYRTSAPRVEKVFLPYPTVAADLEQPPSPEPEGMLWDDLPTDYLQWIAHKSDMDAGTKANARHRMKQRGV